MANLVSLARPLLGLVVFVSLGASAESVVVLPVVVAACFSDWMDGELARRRGTESPRGRMLDGLCDAIFLALVFAAMARIDLWSPPVWGRAIQYWAGANWLPLIALAASFTPYLLRMRLDLAAGRSTLRSPRGHTAGVANYVLAIVGAVELWPGIHLGPWVLEPVFVTVALLNVGAVGENVAMLAAGLPHRDGDGRKPPGQGGRRPPNRG
jgi:phosphatidylglycerophosphate synthase